MLSDSPRAHLTFADPDAVPQLEAPDDLVSRYLDLVSQRRALDDQIAYLRAELELAASAVLTEAAPRGRFVVEGGQVAARLYPTCSFDRSEVGKTLQRMGRLTDVATIQGPSLARVLAKDAQLRARLGALVRHRHGVALVAGARRG